MALIYRRALNGNETSDSSLRQDFLTYLLSLMRGNENEHGDSLPKLEMTSLQHVAYILDAFVYYLRSKKRKEVAGEFLFSDNGRPGAENR